jgi:hypothetical protein
LVFLRFKLMRGQLTQAAYDAEVELVRSTLTGYVEANGAAHWQEFLAAFK